MVKVSLFRYRVLAVPDDVVLPLPPTVREDIGSGEGGCLFDGLRPRLYICSSL